MKAVRETDNKMKSQQRNQYDNRIDHFDYYHLMEMKEKITMRCTIVSAHTRCMETRMFWQIVAHNEQSKLAKKKIRSFPQQGKEANSVFKIVDSLIIFISYHNYQGAFSVCVCVRHLHIHSFIQLFIRRETLPTFQFHFLLSLFTIFPFRCLQQLVFAVLIWHSGIHTNDLLQRTKQQKQRPKNSHKEKMRTHTFSSIWNWLQNALHPKSHMRFIYLYFFLVIISGFFPLPKKVTFSECIELSFPRFINYLSKLSTACEHTQTQQIIETDEWCVA